MRSTIRYVGLDVHKETLVIAVAESAGGAPEVVATIANHWPTLHKQLKRLGRPEGRIFAAAMRRVRPATGFTAISRRPGSRASWWRRRWFRIRRAAE